MANSTGTADQTKNCVSALEVLHVLTNIELPSAQIGREEAFVNGGDILNGGRGVNGITGIGCTLSAYSMGEPARGATRPPRGSQRLTLGRGLWALRWLHIFGQPGG